MPQAIIDTRESNDQLRVALMARGWDRGALKYGDFKLWCKDQTHYWLIERKTVSDLLESIKDGRLRQQAHGMADDEMCERAILLLEANTGGSLTRTSDDKINGSNWTWNGVFNYISRLQGPPLGLSLEITLGTDHTISRLLSLQELALQSVSTVTTRSWITNPQVAALALTPGIGESRAQALYDAGVRLELAGEPSSVKGIGDKMSEKIKRIWSNGNDTDNR